MSEKIEIPPDILEELTIGEEISPLSDSDFRDLCHTKRTQLMEDLAESVPGDLDMMDEL